MNPRIYSRHELVNNEVEKIAEKIAEKHIDIIDKSIMFWYSRQQSHIATGDNNGGQSAGLVLGCLNVIKRQMQNG